MSDSPAQPDDLHGQPGPVNAPFQHQAVTARVREAVGVGVFANAAIVLSGQFEFVIDFLLRMGKPERIMARIVLPFPVAEQFVQALRDSLVSYERQYGPLPEIGRPHPAAAAAANDPDGKTSQPEATEKSPGTLNGHAEGKEMPAGCGADSPASSRRETTPPAPSIDELYAEIKLDEALLGGSYANAVLIRHSATEFCFDFVAHMYPRSSVNARVFMAAPQVKPFWNSLSHSCQQYRRHFGSAE